MATIKSGVTWGSGPTNYFDFSYDKYRSGATQYYRITVSCRALTGTSYFGYPIYVDITLNGTKILTKHTLKGDFPTQWSEAISYTTEYSGVNKTSGTTPISIRIYSGNGSVRDSTYKYDLAVDPAPSEIAATDANIGSTSMISITKYNPNYISEVSYHVTGMANYATIFSDSTRTSYAWTVPESMYDYIKGDREIEVTLRCTTFSGTDIIGITYAFMTATTSEAKCRPDVAITAKDTRAATVGLTGDNQKIVKGFSTLEATVTATVKKMATLSLVTVSNGSTVYSNTKSPVVVTFPNAESASVTASAKDSREYVGSNTENLTLINYSTPTINPEITRENPTSDIVNVRINGIWFNGSFGKVTNTLAAKVRYKAKDQSSFTGNYTTMAITVDGSNYTATTQFTGLPYTSAYDIEFVVSDALHSGSIEQVVTKVDEIRRGIPIFDWGENDFNFNVPVTFSAGYSGEGSSSGGGTGYEYGVSGMWKYKKYEDGTAECWGILRDVSDVTWNWASGIYASAEPIYADFPFAFSEIPTVIASSQGDAMHWLVASDEGTITVNNTPYYNLARPTSATINFELAFYVFGRWK